MAEPGALDYFYGTEAEQYTFYRIPKVLFTDPGFRRITADAKILYGLMLDRMGLSIRNGWLDEQERVFIYFTLEEAMDAMCCGHNKAVSLFTELDNPVCYFFIRNCTRSQYLVKRRSNGKNQPDQNIQTWFSPVIFYCREKTRADICTFCNLLTGIFSLFSCTSVRGAKGINGLLLFLSHAPSPHIIVLYLDYEVFKMI